MAQGLGIRHGLIYRERERSACLKVCATDNAVMAEVLGFTGFGPDSLTKEKVPAEPDTSMSWRVSTKFGEATSSTETRSSERLSSSSSLAPLPRVAHASAMETLTLPGNFAIASAGRPLKRTKDSAAFSSTARSSSFIQS